MCISIRHLVNRTSVGLLLAAISFGNTPTASADQCIPDDLVVDGSIGVGFDAVCNMNFGFDTIVLKENNLRIFFDDTSNSASFPNNDWRILINDTTNGGAAFFGVEDTTAGTRPFIVTKGAGNNALFVDNGGEVGLGTSVPVVNLHIVDGNTPTVRLDQNGSQGFTPQVWDLAGNEANFFIRDVTNGSKLPFRITPNTPSNTIRTFTDHIAFNDGAADYDFQVKSDTIDNALFVDGATGNLTVGAGDVLITPAAATNTSFVRTGSANAIMRFTADRSSNLAAAYVFQGATGASSMVILESRNVGIQQDAPATPLQVVNAQCDGNNWNNTSSRELKENIRELTADEALQTVKSLSTVKFAYKSQPDEECIGFIAEDVPDLVARNDRRTLQTMDIVGVLTKVVQGQESTIEKLNSRIDQLEQRLTSSQQ